MTTASIAEGSTWNCRLRVASATLTTVESIELINMRANIHDGDDDFLIH